MTEPATTEDCRCVPQVFARRHRDELLLAWFWPDGPMWLQPGGGVPVEVTSDQFAATVELGWMRIDVAPGTTGIRVETPTGPAHFELIR
jgi:hypothetical protein